MSDLPIPSDPQLRNTQTCVDRVGTAISASVLSRRHSHPRFRSLTWGQSHWCRTPADLSAGSGEVGGDDVGGMTVE